MRWGPHLAVRYLLRPAPDTPPAPSPPRDDPHYLSTEAAGRLAAGGMRFELCVQRYANEGDTPIEDTAVDWSERAAPPGPSPCSRSPHATVDGRRDRAGPRRRRPGLQPVEHHRRVPAAGQPQPRPQGGLRRRRRPPAGHRWETSGHVATRSPAPWPGRASASSTASCRGTGCRCALGPAQPRGLPRHAADAEPARHRAARGAADRAPRAAGPARRGVAPGPQPRRLRQRPLGAAMGAVGSTFGRNLRPVYRPDLFDEPNPDRGQPSAAAPASGSSRRARSTSSPRPGSSSRCTTGSRTPRKQLGEDDVKRAAAGRPDLAEHARRASPRRQMRIAGNVPYAGAGAATRPGLRQHELALVGRLGGVRLPTPRRASAAARRRASCASPPRATCRRTSRASR